MSEIVAVADEPQPHPLSDRELAVQERERNNATPSPGAPRGMKAIVASFKQGLGAESQSESGDDVQGESSTKPPSDNDVEERREPFTSAKAADWKKLKSQLANERLSAAEYKKRYAELVRGNGDSEIEKIKSERDQFSAELQRVKLEAHPQFATRFQARLNESIQAAHAELGGQSPLPELTRLFELPAGVQRDQILSQVRRLAGSDVARARFDSAVASYDKTRSERDDALARAKENLQRAEALQAMEQQRATDMENARRESYIAQALEAAKTLPSFKRTGDAKHDAAVDRNVETVRRFLRNELPPDQMISFPIVVSEARHLIENVVPGLAKENQELKAALQELRHTSAPLTGGSRRGDSEEKPRKTFVEAVTEGWRGMLKD